jgi:DNA-directed RNA polymerase beta' subunit
VLVNNDGLAIQSLLKIQSGRCRNAVDPPFDGDEMNMHIGQNVLAETELRNLAAIPYQIISPANNGPIIGIYQDSLLGSYRFTREEISLNPREAMNLLMMYSKVNPTTLFANRNRVTNFDVLSQIMPPLTIKYKTKLWDNDANEDPAISNNILEIRNGKYIRGQIEKSVLGSGTKGLIHRVCNDFGNRNAADFIDDLQNVITEYMKRSSYSVGVSDLMSNRETSAQITEIIKSKKLEVAALIQKVHTGIFENNTSHSQKMEFETQVNNILNDATKDSDKVSRKSLNQNNRFLMIVNSGSKGTLLNISHMISCLGQVNVDGKRVPYGFDSRTLPHFSKFDDSPGARGFIENSYINGLTASELFFHAMGGRVGLIDTAVKSVSWETPIVLLEKGKPIYTEIGRWIDSIIDSSNDVNKYDEKNMELVNIDSGIVYVPTMNEHGEVTWEEITAVTRHDPGNVLYEIKSLGGRSVIVTESKSLLIWNDEKGVFNEVLTPDIKVGDCLPVTKDLCEAPVTEVELSSEQIDHILGCILSGEFDVIPDGFIFNINNCIRLIEKISELNHQVFHTNSEKDRNLIGMAYSRTGVFVTFDGNDIYPQNYFKSHNNVVLDPIVSITPLSPEKYPKMYDLTIPTTLNFGLANGLQVRDTSQTGYIQRRLIKGLEDLKVEYDMTVRNSRGKIIQFLYGDDGFDPMKTETQTIPIVSMSTQDIYMHYDMVGLTKEERGLDAIYTKGTVSRLRKQREETKALCKKYIDRMMEARDKLVDRVFRFKDDSAVVVPVAFQHTINNVQGSLGLSSNSLVDITPLEAFQLIEEYFSRIKSLYYAPPTDLFETMYYYYLNPRELLAVKRFHRNGLVVLLETVFLKYKQAIVHPGEMVGVVAGQSIGEPTTQMTLNSFTYETEILVRNSAGEIKCVQIGDFVKWGIDTTKNMDYMKEKDTTYAELSEFYEVPSATEDGNTIWCRIEAVTKHPVINEDGTNTMVKVTTRGNREIIATKAKSFLQFIDGKIQGVNGSDLKVGDYLPVSKLTYGLSVSLGFIEDIYPIVYSEVIPHIIGSETMMEPRNNRCVDLEFDQIVSIEEVPNTTDYAYDLTVENTRLFDCMNGVCVSDTFHLAGVASKSNVTRGVPRIEEILRLTSNPKHPSLTVFLKQMDEDNADKAKQFANMMEHTKLADLVKSVNIHFDPDDKNTNIAEDKELMEQYYAFTQMVETCNADQNQTLSATEQKSKWIVRMEMDTESLLDKNITMDDIHFAIRMSSFGTEYMDCVYSDFNSDKLVFRLRVNTNYAKDKKRRGPEPLDQTDEIYLLKKYQDDLLNSIVLRGVHGIDNVIPRKLQNMVSKQDGKYERRDTWILDTTGTNLLETLALDYIDNKRTFSNDIKEIFDVLGIEAARQVIHNELVEVMEFSGAYINYHHLSLLCDRMTCNKDMVSIFRTGLFSDDIGPIAKATFEVHTEVLLDAARFGDFDSMRGVSANVMCGQPGYYGTNAFQLVLDMEAMASIEANDAQNEEEDILDTIIGMGKETAEDSCSRKKVEFSNNIKSIPKTNPGICDDGYDIGF